MSGCPSVRPSVRQFIWNNTAVTAWNFTKFDILSILRKPVDKIEVSLKPDMKSRYFTWRPIYIFDHIFPNSACNKKCFKVIEEITANVLFSITFFFIVENRSVYEIMLKNIVEPYRPQMTIWRMRIACWVPKVTKTHSEYVILIDFPLSQRLHERASVLLCTYIVLFKVEQVSKGAAWKAQSLWVSLLWIHTVEDQSDDGLL